MYAARAATGLAANLRYDVFSNIQRFSFSNLDKFSTPSLVTRLTTDINNVLMAYQSIIRQAVRSVAMIVFALTAAFRTNSQVAMVFLAAIPVLGAGLFSIILNVHPIFVMALKTYDRLNNVVQENLRGIRCKILLVKMLKMKSLEEYQRRFIHTLTRHKKGLL